MTQEQRDKNKTSSYQQWEVDKLIDDKNKAALKEYDDNLKFRLVDRFLIELAPYKSAYNVGKFIVVAVALLVIGTLYQLFVSLASAGVGK